MNNLEKQKRYAREEVDQLFSATLRRLNDNPSEEKLIAWDLMLKWVSDYPTANAEEQARLDGLFHDCVPELIRENLVAQDIVPSEYMREKIIAHKNYKEEMFAFAWSQLTLSEYLILQATDYDGLQEAIQNIRVGLPLAEAEFLENTPRP